MVKAHHYPGFSGVVYKLVKNVCVSKHVNFFVRNAHYLNFVIVIKDRPLFGLHEVSSIDMLAPVPGSFGKLCHSLGGLSKLNLVRLTL